MSRSNVALMSAAVMGLPLWNMIPGLRWKVRVLPFGLKVHRSASHGTMRPSGAITVRAAPM